MAAHREVEKQKKIDRPRHGLQTVLCARMRAVVDAQKAISEDPKTVLSTYAHLLPESDELAAERVAAALLAAQQAQPA